jgi:hypothetical protein
MNGHSCNLQIDVCDTNWRNGFGVPLGSAKFYLHHERGLLSGTYATALSLPSTTVLANASYCNRVITASCLASRARPKAVMALLKNA